MLCVYKSTQNTATKLLALRQLGFAPPSSFTAWRRPPRRVQESTWWTCHRVEFRSGHGWQGRVATVLLALFPVPCARVGIPCHAGPGVAGKDTHHQGTCSAPAPAPVLALPSLPLAGTQQGKRTPSFPNRVPPHQPGSKREPVSPLLQLKKEQSAIWKLDMVRKWNLTYKQLRMWVMRDTQPHICTQFAQSIPVIFQGWNKTPVQQAPQLWRAGICSRVLQPGFPSEGNISRCSSPVPLFQMLSMFSAPATHGWR